MFLTLVSCRRSLQSLINSPPFTYTELEWQINFITLDVHNQATGYASQHICCLSQEKINWEDCVRKGIRRKNGGDDGGGSLISLDGVASSQIVSVSASNIFPCTIKSRRRILQVLAPAHPGSPQEAVKWLCVCVCMRACMYTAYSYYCYYSEFITM